MDKLLWVSALVLAVFLLQSGVCQAFSAVYFMEPADGTVQLSVNESWSSIDSVYFKTEGQKSGYRIRVDKIQANSSRIFDYFTINTEGLQTEPKEVVFVFRVGKSWIESGKIVPDTISVNIYTNEWQTAGAVRYGEDDGFYYYMADSPKLAAAYAVTGEPLPIGFDVSRPCNGNRVCEPGFGETSENCPDCVTVLTGKCVPGEQYCMGDYVFSCNSEGSDYALEKCDYGCADGKCAAVSSSSIPSGMIVAANPYVLSVVVILLAVVLYMGFALKRVRDELRRLEKQKSRPENIKEMALQ